MKKLLFIAPAVFFTIGAMVGLTSCGGDKGPTVTKSEVLKAYIESQETPQQQYDTYSAYFDLSDGMLAAYNYPETKGNLEKILNKVTGNSKCTKIYGLKNDAIEPLDVSQTQLYNYIMAKTSYSRIAPIERALAQITSSDQAAFLLTDYEEYNQGKIHRQAYAKKYFIDWLSKGNDITFFVIDYKEGKLDKHLYLSVFDSPNGALLKDIENALSTGTNNYSRFNLTSLQYTAETCYDRHSNRGGVYRGKKDNDVISSLKETEYAAFIEYNAEYYPLREDWKHVVGNAKGERKSNEEEIEGRPIYQNWISGLTLDFQPMSGYNVEALSLTVTNIEKDFDDFEDEYKAKAKGKEVEHPYSPIPGKEVFGLIKYTGTVQNNVAQVSFDVENDLGLEDDMLRVDVLISEVGVNESLVNALFALTDNNSLRDSILYTLQEWSPKGRVVYTYYIQAR